MTVQIETEAVITENEGRPLFTGGNRPKIARADMKNRVLSVEDGSFIGDSNRYVEKIVLCYCRYDSDPSITATHNLDPKDARIIADDLSYDRKRSYVEYKGNPNKVPVVAKVLSIEYDPTEGKQGYWFKFKQGPGRVTSTKAVQPATGAALDIDERFKVSCWEGRRIGYALKEYMAAKAVARMLGAK